MKLTERSDAELSKFIAEKIEPMPLERPNWSQAESPLKVWTSSFKGFISKSFPPNQEDYPDAQYGWKQRDMVNDAQMTVMLMEKLPPNSEVSITHNTLSLTKRVKHNAVYTIEIDVGENKGRVFYKADGPTFGRAVALAYALAHGWTEESVDGKV